MPYRCSAAWPKRRNRFLCVARVTWLNGFISFGPAGCVLRNSHHDIKLEAGATSFQHGRGFYITRAWMGQVARCTTMGSLPRPRILNLLPCGSSPPGFDLFPLVPCRQSINPTGHQGWRPSIATGNGGQNSHGHQDQEEAVHFHRRVPHHLPMFRDFVFKEIMLTKR